MRISSYLKYGEGIWWQRKEDGFQFYDDIHDPDFHLLGPTLDHFRSFSLPDVYCKMSQDWDNILQNQIDLPSPKIRIYSADGSYQYSTSSLSLPLSFNVEASTCTSSETEVQTRALFPPPPQATSQAPPRAPLPQTTCVPTQPLTPALSLVLSETMLTQPLVTPEMTATQLLVPPQTMPTQSLVPPEIIPTKPLTSQIPPETTPSQLPGPPEIMPTQPLVPPETIPTQPLTSQVPPETTPTQPLTSQVPPETTPSQLLTPTTLPEQTTPSQLPASSATLYSSGEETPTHSNTLLPINLFENVNDAEGKRISVKLNVPEVVNVTCEIDSLGDICTCSTVHGDGLQTKAAKLFHKIIGQDEKLIRYDMLRTKFKSLQQNKETPTKTERTEYESLLTEIHSRILSIKQTTRNELKMVEKQYMTSHTTTTLRNSEYKNLYKKFELIKKVLSIWTTFDV